MCPLITHEAGDSPDPRDKINSTGVKRAPRRSDFFSIRRGEGLLIRGDRDALFVVARAAEK